MRIIPVKSLASQTLGVLLNEQNTLINVYQKFYGLYIDVFLNDVLVIGGVIARDRNRIIRSEYFNYLGDFAFFDTEGDDDPDYTGLGERFLLAYLTEDEFTQFGVT